MDDRDNREGEENIPRVSVAIGREDDDLSGHYCSHADMPAGTVNRNALRAV